jgi:hypothetical protein
MHYSEPHFKRWQIFYSFLHTLDQAQILPKAEQVRAGAGGRRYNLPVLIRASHHAAV